MLTLLEIEARYTVSLKVLYFSIYAAFCSCSFFKMKFFKDVLGISEDNSMLVFAMCYIVVTFGSTFWNYMSDWSCRPKLMLFISTTGMCGVFQLFQLMSLISDPYREPIQIFVILIWTFFQAGMLPAMDGIAIKKLKSDGHGRELFGRQRLFGTLGNTFITLLSGKLIDNQSKKGGSREQVANSYMPMFYIIGITSFIFLVLLYLLMPNDDPIQEHAIRKREEEEKKGNIGHQTRNQQLRSLLTNWGFLFVLAISMIVGYGNTNLSALRAYYSETKLLNKENEPKQLTSLLSLFGVIFEILSFFFAKRLLQFVGKYNMLTIALFMMICRCWSYYLVPEGSKSWFFFILAIECFCRGIQVGTLYSASVQIASEVAGPDLQATAQGIVSSVNYGLSGVVGSLGASLVLKVTDNHFKSVFLVAGILTSCSLVCVGGFNYWRYKSAKKSEVEVVDVEKVEK